MFRFVSINHFSVENSIASFLTRNKGWKFRKTNNTKSFYYRKTNLKCIDKIYNKIYWKAIGIFGPSKEQNFDNKPFSAEITAKAPAKTPADETTSLIIFFVTVLCATVKGEKWILK